MRAAVFYERNAPLSVEEVAVTDPGPRDVVIRMGASGLCHSDLNAILLGVLVEAVTGESLDAFAAREVFAPLHLAATRA